MSFGPPYQDPLSDRYRLLPIEMRAAQRWLVWAHGKQPFYVDGTPRRGLLDSQDDLARLGTFDAALACLRQHPDRYLGVGFALGVDGDGGYWQGIDLDGLADHEGLTELASKLPSYVETSPSGRGVHAIGYGAHFKTLGHDGSGIEAYSSARYFTVTGLGIGSDELVCLANFVAQTLVPLRRRDEMANPLVLELQGETHSLDLTDLNSALEFISPGPYGDWTRIGQALKPLGDHGLALWLKWSATSPKFNHNQALLKWRSFTADRTGPAAIFAEAQRRGWSNPSRPYWSGVEVLPFMLEGKWRVKGQRFPPSPKLAEGARKQVPLICPLGDQVVMRRVSDVTAEPVRWLWPMRVAIGKLTNFAGDPGLGKSQLAAFMAAKVTTGGAWPNHDGIAPEGNVIMLSCEDDIADTIRPRLEAAGANLDRVHVIEAVTVSSGGMRGFSLTEDLAKLEQVLQDVGDVRLVVVDPITAYLGGSDTHKTGDVRAALAPMQELASRYRVAVVAITHFNKSAGNGKSINAITGSNAFVAASRATFIVTKDSDDPTRRFLTEAKNNLAQAPGLAFGIEQTSLADGLTAPRVVFENGTIELTADQAIGEPHQPEPHSASDAAAEFLRTLLAHGPVPAKQVLAEAKDAGITEKTLRRTAGRIGVIIRKEEKYQGGWMWGFGMAPARVIELFGRPVGASTGRKDGQDGQFLSSQNEGTFGAGWPSLDRSEGGAT